MANLHHLCRPRTHCHLCRHRALQRIELVSHPRVVTKTGAFKWNWSILVVFVFFIVATLLNIGYTNHIQHQSEERNRKTLRTSQQVWCGLLIGIIKIPANTQAALIFHKQLYVIATSYGCQNVPQVPPRPKPGGSPGSPSPATTASSSG